MQYASITRNDRNPIKRFLQRKRLQDAVGLTDRCRDLRSVLDYGAGDGELARLLASRDPRLRVVCYEPCSSLREQAAANTQGVSNVEVVGEVESLERETFDLVICAEVFEHLPPAEIEESLVRMGGLLRTDGRALIGVPIEVFLPALFKGLFRMARRRGEFDARAGNVLRASVGAPPRDRPVSEIAPGMRYYFHHMGFDHRRLRGQLQPHFSTLDVVGSPCSPLGTFLNSEVYFLLQKR